MKRSARNVMAVVMGIVLVSFLISCASTGSQTKEAATAPPSEGFLDGYYPGRLL
jgi:branched-subunit amino acid permease